MAGVGLSLQVRQKVSAIWSLASIGIANSAILMGAFAALKGSVILTPSLMRRWRMETLDMGMFEPYEMIIPVRLIQEETGTFINFVIKALKDLENHPVKKTSMIKRFDQEDGNIRIDFIYKAPGATAGNFYTKNSLHIEKFIDNDNAFVKLLSYGDQEWAYTTGSLLRMIAVRWSTSESHA